MMVYIEVKEITGKVHTSNTVEAEGENLASLLNVLTNIKKLDYLLLESGRESIYFNPDHIIYARVVEVSD